MSRILKSVEAEGYRSIVTPIRFELDRPGLNIIEGVNGVGKTTIIESIVWCAYGQNLKDTNQDAIPSWEEKRPSSWRGTRVMLNFIVNGEHYTIARHMNYKGITFDVVGGDTLMVWQGDDEHGYEPKQLWNELNKADTQERINQLLGANYKTFVNSILFGQRMVRLVTQDNKDKRVLLEQLFDVEWVNIAKVRADADITTKNNERQEILNEQGKISHQIMMLENDLVKDKQVVDNWRIKHEDDIIKVNSSIDMYKRNIVIYEETKAKLNEGINYDENKHNKVEEQWGKISDQVDASKVRGDEIKKQLTAAQADHRLHSSELASKTREKLRIEKQIEDNKKALITLKDRGVCPTCNHELSSDEVESISAGYSIEEGEREIFTCNKEMTELNRLVLSDMDTELKFERSYKTWSEGHAILVDNYNGITQEFDALNDLAERVNEKAEKLAEMNDLIKADKVRIEELKARIDILKTEEPPFVDFSKAEEAIRAKNSELASLSDKLIKKEDEIKVAKWWSEKGFGSSGIKAFIFNAMLAQLNEGTRKYGKRLGVSLEFAIDLTKASKPFTTICSLGDKLNKDYKEFSGGEKQRLDIVLIFAMYDLVSINTNFNVLIMDEVFEGLDEKGENDVFDLIRLKANEGKSVYIITHSSVVDRMHANTIQIEESNLTTKIVN